MAMNGQDLYIGFKGVPMSNRMTPKSIRQRSFLDVTQLVNSIKK